MSTVKISQLAEITQLNANTANSLFMGVDLPTGITGKFTAHVLAQGLYSNEVLNVGNNTVVLPDVAGQFAGRSEAYVQINHQNLNGNGSGDIVVTANMGTDSTYYIDIGMNGNTYNYDGFTYAKPLDGYLIVQGETEELPGGNLVIGTTTPGKDILFVNGSIDESEIVVKYTYHKGLELLQKPLWFADGSAQNTAAASLIYTQASYTKANTVNTYAYSANTFLQANDATTLAVAIATGQANVGSALAAGKVYTDTANTWLQANDATTLGTAKFYSDSQLGNSIANVHLYIDSAYAHANAGNILASAAYTQANTTATALTITNSVAQGGFNLATAANNKMQSAYDLANTALVNYDDRDNSGVYNTAAMSEFGLHLNFEDGFGLTGYVDIDTLGNIVSLGDVTASDIVANNSIRANSMTVIGTSFAPTEAAVTISATPTVATPANDGYMLQISGKTDVASRIINESYGTGVYSLFAGRSARGNVTNPTAVQTGDVIARYSSSGYGTTKYQPLGTGRIDFVAAENYTDTATGSQIQFWNCPVGSNTLTNIATFNGDSATFTGVVNPQKGFVLTPNVRSDITNTLNVNFATDSLYKVEIDNTATVNLSGYTAGKIVEVWMINSSGSNRVVTHGCLAINSTRNATTFTIPATSCAYLKYFSIDGDNANTFVSIVYA